MEGTPNNLIQLKAAAYDCLAQIEWQQRELARLNALIVDEAAKGSVIAPISESTATVNKGKGK